MTWLCRQRSGHGNLRRSKWWCDPHCHTRQAPWANHNHFRGVDWSCDLWFWPFFTHLVTGERASLRNDGNDGNGIGRTLPESIRYGISVDGQKLTSKKYSVASWIHHVSMDDIWNWSMCGFFQMQTCWVWEPFWSSWSRTSCLLLWWLKHCQGVQMGPYRKFWAAVSLFPFFFVKQAVMAPGKRISISLGDHNESEICWTIIFTSSI